MTNINSNDNFFGGESYGGRLVVFYKNEPIWMMVYYGFISQDIDTKLIYKVLRNALLNMPGEYPFRGPENYQQDPYAYTNAWQGKLERFSGKEMIHLSDKSVYQASYMGGLIDQR
ncbi:MAG: hypothetical protein HY860_00340 [Chlamydiales bacterium]|nr:hypothetical protein [Chlamydiales bacterium]